MCFRPLSIGNWESFQSYVGVCDPNFKIPCHTTVKNYLHKIYFEKKTEMMKTVSSQSGVALTTDLWTSAATEGYTALTSHYIDENWELRSQVLTICTLSERHKGKNTAEEIKNIVDEFKINVVTVTHDNASNMDTCLALHFWMCWALWSWL